ncbi:MAG TPA: DnaA N-terminal domain-containing protein [Myxococcota bacterium]|nr:DnaA N-terminal domain-containing protein [Myxococcota bacterium]
MGDWWKRVCERLRAELGDAKFNSWFVRVELENVQAGVVYLLEDPAPGTPLLSSIAVRLKGESGGDALGPVTMLGDSNGDGIQELAVAAPTYSTADAGRVFVMNLPITADTNVSSATAFSYFTHSVSTDQIGSALASGDVNGDGFPDLIIGAPLFNGTVSDVGAVFVCEGGFSSGSHSVNSGSTCTRLLGTTAELAGAALAVADTDDDGTDDLIIGAYRNASGVGAVYFVDGPSANANLGTSAPVQVKFTGETLGDYFGWSVASAGDVDQDGRVDVLVGARTYNSSSAIADNGAVYLIDGATRTGTVAVSTVLGSSGARFVGDSALDYLGWAVGGPGDVTNDGVPDLLLGAAGYDATALGAGSVSLFSGSGL